MKKEAVVLIVDLIHSCSNVHVARAALASIGGEFADRVDLEAKRIGIDAATFVCVAVKNFARCADKDALRLLDLKISGADQPLLCGLAHVVGTSLESSAPNGEDAFGDREKTHCLFAPGIH